MRSSRTFQMPEKKSTRDSIVVLTSHHNSSLRLILRMRDSRIVSQRVLW